MDLSNFFHGLTDPRTPDNQTYPFEALMLMAICGVMAGIDSYTGIEDFSETHKSYFDTYFNLTYIPRHDTFNRLFQALDMGEFENWFRKKATYLIEFMESHPLPVVATHQEYKKKRRHIAIDGKTIRNSGFEKAYHIVTAWLSNHEISLGQVTVEEKSNEIIAIPLLLDEIDIQDTLITIDAIGCQRKICEKILEKKGDYIIAVKDNQPHLYDSVRFSVEEHFEESYSTCTTNEKGHGRQEARSCLAQKINEDLFDFQAWPGIKSIFCIDSDVVKKKKGGTKKRYFATRYFISSATLDSVDALDVIRAHWGIETKLHWRLDVSLNEDDACVLLENAAVNLNALRKFALNTLTVIKGKNSMKSMFRNGMNPKKSIEILNKIYDA